MYLNKTRCFTALALLLLTAGTTLVLSGCETETTPPGLSSAPSSSTPETPASPIPGPTPTSTPVPIPTPSAIPTPSPSPSPSPTFTPQIPLGILLKRSLKTDPLQEYYVYLPSRGSKGAPIFISVHGISENVDEHASLFKPFAEKYGVVLIAPHFPQTRYDDYQRLGRDGARADLALREIVSEVRELSGASAGPFSLFGYSGGAQFTHRYAMAHPEDIDKFAVGAAGWYTFPDPDYDYAQGIGDTGGLVGVEFKPTRFLQVPGAVFVGNLDIELSDSLNQDPEINEQQGVTRYERGQRWIQAMSSAEVPYGLKTTYVFNSVSGCAHSFGTCMSKGMGQSVFTWLFGSP